MIRERWEEKYRVRELERYYLGQQEPNQEGNEEAIWLNHFFATVQTQKPALLPRDISFQVVPKAGREPFSGLEAKIQEGALRAIAEGNDHHLNYEAGLALSQAFFRMGILKVSYDPRFEPNPRAGQPLVREFDGLGEENIPREPRQVLTDEVYLWEWVDAKRMLFPDAGPNPRKWPWICEEIELTLDAARNDTQFPQSLRQQFVANGFADPSGRHANLEVSNPQIGEQEHARFRYIEGWDIDNKRRVAWADGQPFQTFILDEPYQEGIDDFPYALLAFIPILGPETCPWPMPLVYNWLPLQQQYNTLRQQQINAGRRATRKWLYEQQTFADAEEADKFNSDVDMQGVMINDMTHPPIMFGEAPLNVDVTRNIPFLRDDWTIITGGTGPRTGDPDADTATEAVLAEQAASLRDSEMRAMVDMWLAQAGSRMLQLVKQTMELDLWVQLQSFSNPQFQELLQTPGFQAVLAMRFGPENVQRVTEAIQTSPALQESFKERFGQLKPVQVTRTELQFESDVRVVPNNSRPVQQAKILRMVQGLPSVALMGSPTLLEEYIQSFDLVSADRITEEIMLTIRSMQQQAQQGIQASPGRSNGARVPGAGTGGQSPLTQIGGQGRLGL